MLLPNDDKHPAKRAVLGAEHARVLDLDGVGRAVCRRDTPLLHLDARRSGESSKGHD